ncbi:hypothetical protein D3C86_1920190 [compost metagenome]
MQVAEGDGPAQLVLLDRRGEGDAELVLHGLLVAAVEGEDLDDQVVHVGGHVGGDGGLDRQAARLELGAQVQLRAAVGHAAARAPEQRAERQ